MLEEEDAVKTIDGLFYILILERNEVQFTSFPWRGIALELL